MGLLTFWVGVASCVLGFRLCWSFFLLFSDAHAFSFCFLWVLLVLLVLLWRSLASGDLCSTGCGAESKKGFVSLASGAPIEPGRRPTG